MNFVINPKVFENFPDLSVGVIIATDIDNSCKSPEIEEMLRNEEESITKRLDIDSYRDNPKLSALQEVHRSFGNNPNKFPPSIQGLVKRILKGGSLPIINPIVDLYNIISLRHLVCAGAEDFDTCSGDIQLDYANGTESFIPLGENVEDPPKEGELVYKDDIGVICRKLNWREGDRTKITDGTKNALIVLEGFSPFAKEDLEQALNELSEYLIKYCNAETSIKILTKEILECSVK
ncbi:hypothetical protein HN512_00765 [Candidatus Peregrinibacteria bacterium]|jgi:lysyl-tRNA synthetase class 2|nr:hypothetical protein [Candidatus Peregrinibacteria bacterium]MBT3598351.1 hypothetical protein [Candidatus Peregrinibacteria bacterium]MBT4367724.1 hypothetical protein [Candidatus Peregrinibacteria bacterium]MBT4585701.1 hypothetical protein [Candidatus Peregrinibacteria bacterium]MBT6730545.1 hypothetical protein [Candidatus Peregrinibacteria bacterium]